MVPNVDNSMECMQDEIRQRKMIISALYVHRKMNPHQPNLNLSELEQVLGVPKEQFEFSLWYLTGGAFVKRADNGNLSILLKGVDLAETILGLRNAADGALIS